MLVRPDNGAIDVMDLPIELTCGLGLLWENRQHALKDAGLLPTVDATRHGVPWAIALRQIPPGCSRAQDPQHAIQDAPRVDRRATDRGFLGRKQRV
jgi:hypothetical protein